MKKASKLRLTSLRDQEVFFNIVVNPPKPNESLKKAFKKYQQTRG